MPFFCYDYSEYSNIMEQKQEVTLMSGAGIEERKEADACIALGAGVAILGAGAAAVTGAVCPLCVFIAPGLVGYGSYKRWKARKPKADGRSNA